MSSLKEAASGWVNFIMSYSERFPKSDRDLAEERSHVCRTCPKLVKADKIIAKRWPLQCQVCGCVFPVIVYSKNKKCPLGKWKK